MVFWYKKFKNTFWPTLSFVGMSIEDDFVDASNPEDIKKDPLDKLKDKIKEIESSYKRPEIIPPSDQDTNYFSALRKRHYVSFDGSTQIRKETLRVYESLCEFLDTRLEKENTSIIEIERRNRYGYYASDSILYCLFVVSKTQVIHHYKKQYKQINEYYWKSIRRSIHHDVQFLRDELRELVQECPFPDEATRKYLRLNENGYPIVWWDSNGWLRDNELYTLPQQQLLNMTMPRNTKVWENVEVRKKTIDLYLKVFEYILEHQEEYKFNKTNQKVLDRFTNLDTRYLNRRKKKDISYSLMKLCENRIRSQIPSFNTIKEEEEKEIVRRFMPKDLLPKIYEIIEESEIDTHSILIDLLNTEERPAAIQAILKELSIEEQTTFFLEYYHQNPDLLIKILKGFTKKEIDIQTRLMAIFLLEKLGTNVEKLKKILPHENLSEYNKQLKGEPTTETLQYIRTLDKPIRKKIELRLPEIRKSQEELSNVVKLIENYIGDEPKKELSISPKLLIESKKEVKEYNDIIQALIKRPLKVSEVEEYARKEGLSTKAYINGINKYLYTTYEDLVILLEEDSYEIDPYFLEDVKEEYHE